MSWLIVAAGLAGVLAVTELFNHGRKAPCLSACPLLLILFAFDASAGVISYAVIVQALQGLTWFTGAWPAILAGLCGPALLRSQLSLLGSGESSAFYGPANRYRRLQELIENAIDDKTASAQANWIATRALPAVGHVSIDEIGLQSENYFKGINRVSEEKRSEMLAHLDAVLTDAITEAEKKQAIVQYLVDNNGRRHVRTLMRRGTCLAKPDGFYAKYVAKLWS